MSLAESDDHLCHCGKWGAFGHGYFPRQGLMGTWFCGEHNPDKIEPHVEKDEWAYMTTEEVNECARFGLSLQKRAEDRNFKKTPGETADNETLGRQHALSQVTEGVIRRHFGWPLEFNPNGFNEPDLPGRIQVRTITGEYKGLKVKSRDGADWRVVGVIAPPGKERGPYRLPGWFIAGEAQGREEWQRPWFDGPPVFIVPQRLLRPMSELRRLLRSEGLTVADYAGKRA